MPNIIPYNFLKFNTSQYVSIFRIIIKLSPIIDILNWIPKI